MAAILATLLPALISGAFGAASAATSKKPGLKKIPTMSKPQEGLQNQLLQMLQGQLGQGGSFGQAQNYLQNLLSGSPESMQAFQAPAMRQFNEQIVPGLAERFSGLGAGAQSSSAFQQALGQAGAGLAENLQALRSGLQGGAAQSLLGLPSQFLGAAFQSPFAYMQKQGGGTLSNILGGFGRGVAPGLGQLSGYGAQKWMFPDSQPQQQSPF
jgi:hypothetical protein